MPKFAPSTEVIHRTDASVVALPWPEVSKELASESYYRVEFRRAGTHDVMDILVFTVKKGEKDYRLATTLEVFDVAYHSRRETRKPVFFTLIEDLTSFPSVAEAQTAAKIEAILHHAHTKGYRRA